MMRARNFGFSFLSLLVLVACSSSILCSVILSGGSYCSTDGSTVQHAVPGDTISITCSVDNPDGGLNVLVWTIPSIGVSVTNANGADGADVDQPDFVSTVNNFDNPESTTNATLIFTAVSALDNATVNCADVTATQSSCTLFILTAPSVPLDLSCTDVTYNSITVTWDIPSDNGGEPVSYETTRTPGDTTRYTTSTSITETDLIPRMEYTFSIRANNTVGFSNSTDISCTTLGEVFNKLPADEIEVCLGHDGISDFLLVNITSQVCPPPSPNNATTPPFDNFTYTIDGVGSVSTNSCQSVHPISEERDYTISVTVNNIIGPSDPTNRTFDSHWIRNINLNNSIFSYSVVDCTLVDDANVTLNVTSSSTLIQKEQQPYDSVSTTFSISLLPSSSSYSYMYTLLVTAPGTVIASYDGPLTTTPPSASSVALSINSIRSSSLSVSTSISQTGSSTTVVPSTNDVGLSSSVVAGISVTITVLITASIITVILIITYLYTTGSLRHNNSKQSWAPPPQEYEIPVNTSTTTSGLEIKSNVAYGKMNYSTPTDTPSTAGTIMYETVNISTTTSGLEMKSNVAYGQMNYSTATDTPSTANTSMYETVHAS